MVRHCSTVVCTANIPHLLYIEPRDEYSNICSFNLNDDPTKVSHLFHVFNVPLIVPYIVQNYTVDISQLGTSSQDSNMDIIEDNFTTTLDYDWQSQRVSIQLKFLNEGCYHATIKYNNTELHNGDFDIIVLNSTVHKKN